MLLKLLIYGLVFFLLVRYINRLFLKAAGQGPRQSFGPFGSQDSRTKGRGSSLDHIEDAEYEDLSEKEEDKE